MLERVELFGLPEERAQHLLCTLDRQRVEPELAVVGLVPPTVAVLRPVVDQKEDPHRWEALHQRVEEALGLGVSPVEVRENKGTRRDLTVDEHHTRRSDHVEPTPLL